MRAAVTLGPTPATSEEFPVRLPLVLLLLGLSTRVLAGQQAPGAPDGSAFLRLDLPTPTTLRSRSGTPGPDYWQQRVDYVIRASLDTVARSVRGEERITYTNNSPDTLRYRSEERRVGKECRL